MIGNKVISALQSLYGENISIAFCPYKYSMFDCMESVYLAANDADLVTAIVPLDYQTLPDEKWHNERDFFPYPTVTLDAVKEGLYDIIVIHYPYDGCNNVTRLPRSEWTETLKKYGKVCYIPYHGNVASDEWSRFYRMPGARESDIIVLGSDLDYKAFRNENPNYSGKIIQMENSPKADAALIHKNDDIPAEWYTKGKITVVIGTLWTFTHDPFGRMKKHAEIIKKELEKGNTVVYRPHPLVYHAIQAMRPDAVADYLSFIDNMRYYGAIIDDSPALQRALAAADYLYADPSSVIKTYQSYNKPYEVIE